MFQKLKIKERLTKSFLTVSLIAAIAAVVGVIALIIVTNRYSYALNEYGFAQGDIGDVCRDALGGQSGDRLQRYGYRCDNHGAARREESEF